MIKPAKTILLFFIQIYLKIRKIIFEYTDPNPFKEFHIGHLFTNFIGESLARIYEAVGADTRRANYQGDVGMHVSKSIWGLIKKMDEDNITISQLESNTLKERINYLGKAYALGSTAYLKNNEAKKQIKDINYLVYISAQQHLKETTNWIPQVDYNRYISKTSLSNDLVKELYSKGRTWSLEYFELIYKRLGTTFDYYYFESFIGEYGIKIVKEYLKKGVFEKSKGAIIFPGEKYGLHTRVFINSLGLPTYETKELGLAPAKYRDFQYDLSVIITGNEILEYFKVLLTALKLTNPELGNRTKHISHGMVKLPTGKMSSRSGKIITGEWLLDETKTILKSIMLKNGKLEKESIDSTCDHLAVAAVKYSFLKVALGKDIIFDFDDSVSFEGNSGPYIIYTYVRTKSILAKSKHNLSSKKLNNNETLSKYLPNKNELDLLRLIYQYPEIIEQSARLYSPHLIASYIYEISHQYNVFYQKNPILKGVESSIIFRLELTKAISYIIKNGMKLLGIKTVEKM